MEYLLLHSIFFLILIPLVLGNIIPIHKNHKEATGGIINYDSMMRKFVYKVNLSSENIIALLTAKSGVDELSCEVDVKESKMKFSEYGSYREYFYHIQECDGFSIIRLEQAAFLGMQSHVPYKLNPFMVSKLQAEIIPFSQYGL